MGEFFGASPRMQAPVRQQRSPGIRVAGWARAECSLVGRVPTAVCVRWRRWWTPGCPPLTAGPAASVAAREKELGPPTHRSLAATHLRSTVPTPDALTPRRRRRRRQTKSQQMRRNPRCPEALASNTIPTAGAASAERRPSRRQRQQAQTASEQQHEEKKAREAKRGQTRSSCIKTSPNKKNTPSAEAKRKKGENKSWQCRLGNGEAWRGEGGR